MGDYRHVRRILGDVHARAFCHATESAERVRRAVSNVVGEAELESRSAEGYYGNPIEIIHATATGRGRAESLFERMSVADLELIRSDLESRIDGSCTLFMRFEKQAAYAGELRLSHGRDVVAVRVRVLAYPARTKAAVVILSEYLDGLLAKRERH